MNRATLAFVWATQVPSARGRVRHLADEDPARKRRTPPGNQGTGGFLDLPSGKFATDKSSDTSYLANSDQSTPISITGGTFLQGRGNAVTDTHGTWFGSLDGNIWLYSAAKGLEKVASIPPQAGGTGDPYDQHAWRSVAGPCT